MMSIEEFVGRVEAIYSALAEEGAADSWNGRQSTRVLAELLLETPFDVDDDELRDRIEDAL